MKVYKMIGRCIQEMRDNGQDVFRENVELYKEMLKQKCYQWYSESNK